MEKAVSVARDDLASIRTGRANPGMFNRVNIDYYGSHDADHAAVAASTCPRPGWSSSSRTRPTSCSNIEDAIRNSDLGVNPTNDGNVIRVSIPQLTEERRRDLVKQAKAKGEDAKVSVRNIRRKAMEELAPHQEGRRGRRGRGQPRREGSRQDPPDLHAPRSTTWSSTKKASCWRSDVTDQQSTPVAEQPVERTAAEEGVAGRAATCPPRSPSASFLGVRRHRHPAVRAPRLGRLLVAVAMAIATHEVVRRLRGGAATPSR